MHIMHPHGRLDEKRDDSDWMEDNASVAVRGLQHVLLTHLQVPA